MSDKLETNKLLLGERKTESTKTKNVFDKSQVRQIQPFNFINIVLFIHYFRIFFEANFGDISTTRILVPLNSIDSFQ